MDGDLRHGGAVCAAAGWGLIAAGTWATAKLAQHTDFVACVPHWRER